MRGILPVVKRMDKFIVSSGMVLCLGILASSSLVAQPSEYRPPQSKAFRDSNNASIRFERNVNTYFWNAGARYGYADTDYYVDLAEKFTSSLIRTQFTSLRDEQNFGLHLARRLSGDLFAAGTVQSFILSDNQTLGSSNAGIHTAAAGVSYQPGPQFTVTPMIGMRYDKQQLERDEGMNYRLSLSADSLMLDEYYMQMSGQFNQSDLGKRQFKNNAAELNIGTEFSPGSTDSLSVRWLLNRNDFYVPADSAIIKKFGIPSNIRARNEQTYGIKNSLSYDVAGGISADLSVLIESRKITNAFRYKDLSVAPENIPFNTTMQEFRLEGGIDLRFFSASTFGSIGLRIAERDEKHAIERIDGIDGIAQDKRLRQESRLDNTALRTSLQSLLSTQWSTRNTVTFSGSMSVLQYDTPDSLNTDDRDEVLINLSLKDDHRFSAVFSASVVAEATLAHIVYLKREKSANNNWNRIFRLMPELHYQPAEHFRMVNAFEVLANYTVFDFESVVPGIKSYSYRQVAFLDSTSYDMTRTIGVDVYAHVRVFERGELRWSDFSERPLQRIEEVTFSPQVRYTVMDQWTFAAGFRSFAQKRFRYVNNVRQYESTFLSAGPTTAITIRLSPMSLVEVRGWKEFQRQSGGSIVEYSNMTMNIRYFF